MLCNCCFAFLQSYCRCDFLTSVRWKLFLSIILEILRYGHHAGVTDGVCVSFQLSPPAPHGTMAVHAKRQTFFLFSFAWLPSSSLRCMPDLAVRIAIFCSISPNSKVHGASMGPTWGRQDPGGPHVGPMNLAIRVALSLLIRVYRKLLCLRLYHEGSQHFTEH